MGELKTMLRGAVAVGFVGLAACASADRVEEPRVASESQTGSNLPKKNRNEKVQTLGSDSLQTPIPPPFRPPAGAGSP